MPATNKPIVLVGRVKGDPADLPEGIVYHPGRAADAPPRISRQIEEIDDPKQIAWTKRMYEADLDERFAIALQQVCAGEYVYLEFRDALRQRASQSHFEMRRILRDESVAPKGRARAAEILADLEHAEGAEFLVDALESPSAELCAASVKMLGDWQSKVDLAQPAIAARIVKLLLSDDAEVVKNAVHLCAWRDVPGAEKGLSEALAKGSGPLEEVAETLARLATTPESVNAALPHLFRKRQKEYTSQIHFLFQKTLNHPNPAVAQPLRQAMRQYLLTYSGKDRLGQHWADDIAAVADETVLPVLEDIVARAKDPVSRGYALKAICRLQPKQAVERILGLFRKEKPWSMLTELLAVHCTKTDFDRIVAVLYPRGDKRKIQMEEAKMLLEKLGHRGSKFLSENLERLERHAHEWATWKLQGLDIRSALEDFHVAGVISTSPGELLAQIAKDKAQNNQTLDQTDPSTLPYALGTAGLVTHFDTETGFVPCHHEELVRQFAEATGGRFLPEYGIQIWQRQNEDDFDGPYTVQFLYRDRLYRFEAENFGDYYDVESVTRALNEVLARNGFRERYIGLYTGDQCAMFAFADPAAFVPIAKKLGLPLSEHAAEGMEAGRAFENRIFDDLREDE